MLSSRCPEEFASPSISRNQVTKIQGTPDYSNNRSSNHSHNNQLYFVPNSSNMFPHHQNTNNFDVRLQSVNVKTPSQNSFRVPRQEFSSYGFPESQLPWQGSMQGPGEQQLGGIERGTDFSDAKFIQLQQPQEAHWQLIEQQHSKELDHSRQQSMQQVAHAEFPETSYSALLHGPDTPPCQPDPAWTTPVAEVEHRWPLKGATGMHELPIDSFTKREQGPSYGRQEGAAPSSSQHFLPQQVKNKLKAPSRVCSEVLQTSDVEEKNQVHLIPDAGSKVQSMSDSGLSQLRGPGFPDQKWDGQNQSSFFPSEATNISLPSSGQSVLQQQQHVMNTDPERRDGNYSQLQSQGVPQEESTFKQQAGRVLPYGEIPNGSTPNGIDLQQYNSWNALQPPNMNRAYGNHLQHPADAGYNGWGMNAWQEGHFMEHTSCLPYGSGNMNMGPNHAQYGWQTQSAATMAGGFSQFYPEGYYSSGNSCVRQDVSFGGVGETSAFPSPFESYGHYQGSHVYHPPGNQFVTGVGMPLNGAGWNEFSGPQDCARQENQEKLVHAGGQVQPQQLECSRIKGPYISQPANKVVKSGQEMTLNSDGSADKGSSFHEKDVELEGPQVKKQREFSEVNVGAYHINSCQTSSKFPPQPTSEEFDRAFQRSGGAGLPPREFIPGIRFVPSAEQLQEHPTNNGYFPRGSRPGFREENFAAGRNINQTSLDCSSMNTPQDQPLVDLLARQSGDQAQVTNSDSLKSSVYQQSMASVGLENAFSESSYAASQELSESQCIIMKPSNAGGGGPGSVFISSMRNQDAKDEHNGYCNPGHDYSSSVDGGEHIIPYFHPEIQEQRPLYPVHPSQLHPGVQMPEMNEFAYMKAGQSESNAHFRGFSRSALGKFYPPPPFQSHPVHPQRESARLTNTCSEDQNLPEAWAPRIFESAVLASSGVKEFAPKPVSYQATSGFLEKGMFYHPAADESVAMRKSMSLTESEEIRQQGLLSLEAGSVSTQQPENTLYAHTQSPDQIMAKNIVRGTHLRSMTVESQGSARPLYRLRDNEHLRASQPSAYAGGRNLVNLMQIDGDQHQPGHYSDHHTFGVEYSALRDGEPSISSKFGSENISQHQFLASKSSLRPPATLHPKKRKKPVPYLIPWHIVATQPRGQLPSISKAELMWASAANRLPEKDGGDAPSIGIFRAESRLRLTTQLMQQILSPLPSVLIHGNQPVNFECGVYNLAKSALGEACRLMAGTEREIEPARKGIDPKTLAVHGQTRMWNLAKEVAMTRLVERFMERVKRLDFELSRLDCSMSVLELKGKTHDSEKLSIVHRLGKHHGTDFSIDLSENRLVEAITSPGIRRFPPQKYVIAVPMPRTLPEGVRCLSL